MVTSTISLAPNYFFYFVIGSLICVYSSNILADHNVSVYNLYAEKYFQLGPTFSRITYDGIFHARPSKVQNNTVIVEFQKLSVIFQLNNSPDIDINECKSSKGLKEAFLKPFALVYDTNGLLQKIRVSEGEPQVVSNLKLILSSQFQIDTTKILEKEDSHFIEKSSESLIHGTCDVEYNVRNPKNDTYITEKVFDIQSCSEVVNDTFDDSYLTEVCNSVEDKKITYVGVQDLEINLVNPVAFTKSIKMEQTIYKPFKEITSPRLGAAMLTLAELLPKVEVNTISEENLNVEVSTITYTKVNKNIFQDKVSATNRELRNFYKAFACHAYNLNTSMDLIERVIMC